MHFTLHYLLCLETQRTKFSGLNWRKKVSRIAGSEMKSIWVSGSGSWFLVANNICSINILFQPGFALQSAFAWKHLLVVISLPRLIAGQIGTWLKLLNYPVDFIMLLIFSGRQERQGRRNRRSNPSRVWPRNVWCCKDLRCDSEPW